MQKFRENACCRLVHFIDLGYKQLEISTGASLVCIYLFFSLDVTQTY